MMTALLNRPTATLLRNGLLVFGAYLFVVMADAMLAFRDIRAGLPPEMQPSAGIGFLVSLVSNTSGELMMLGLGWLLTMAMVRLLEGETEGRRILAVITLCYVPLLVYSLIVTAALLGGAVDASGLAGITDPRALVAEIRDVIPEALAPLQPVRGIAVIAALAMGFVAVRRSCRLNGFRAGLVLGTYALYATLLTNLGHE